VAKPVTLRDAPDEATARADKFQRLVGELQARGDYRGAFNKSTAAVQAALAREARRRPADAVALYRYFTERNIRLAREMPSYVAEEEKP
jgi:hypothetical protein